MEKLTSTIFEPLVISGKLCHWTLILFVILVFNPIDLKGQNLPIEVKTNKVVYQDLIVFDTLTPDTSFYHELAFMNARTERFINIQADSVNLIIKFTLISNAYSDFPKAFGKIESDVVLKFSPNKFFYRIANFRHIPVDGVPPCESEIKNEISICFKGKSYEKYWDKVKYCTIASMNDFILKIYYVALENQPTKKTIKMNNYFLAKNRR